MFKYSYRLILALTLMIIAASCTDQDYEEDNKGYDTLVLSVTQSVDTLTEINHASNAVTLNWSTGNNGGTGNRITYTLELAKAGTDFASSYTAVTDATQVYEWSANVENLNNIILDKLGGETNQSIDIEARVTANVVGYDMAQQSVVSFSAIPYEAVTSTLYLIGDATPNGWSADNATPMERTDNGIFTWEGTLTEGNFKFITTLGQFLPSYNLGDDGLATLRISYDQPDNQWTITEAGYYEVTANLLTGVVTIEMTDGETPAFDQLYFVGNMTGWSFEPMTVDALDPYLFRLGRYFDQGGDFKFGTSDGSWENMYKATQANAPYTDSNMVLVEGYEPDNKWYLQDDEIGKAYKICVDIRSGNERMLMSEFTPYDEMWLVGDATPNGWDLSNATAMTKTSDYVFTWTGTLTAGELKFSCDKQSDWNGAWFMCASGNDVEPTGETEQALFINKSDNNFKAQYLDVEVGSIDQKWKITQSGTYTITLDQLHETVSITKQ
ncbi:MAG: SusF/SusE family outer membrane protein [Prevotella sp.]|jgi:hypothetical protein